MSAGHSISISAALYERLATEAKRRGITVTKLVLQATADIVGQDEVSRARRPSRRRVR